MIQRKPISTSPSSCRRTKLLFPVLVLGHSYLTFPVPCSRTPNLGRSCMAKIFASRSHSRLHRGFPRGTLIPEVSQVLPAAPVPSPQQRIIHLFASFHCGNDGWIGDQPMPGASNSGSVGKVSACSRIQLSVGVMKLRRSAVRSSQVAPASPRCDIAP